MNIGQAKRYLKKDGVIFLCTDYPFWSHLGFSFCMITDFSDFDKIPVDELVDFGDYVFRSKNGYSSLFFCTFRQAVLFDLGEARYNNGKPCYKSDYRRVKIDDLLSRYINFPENMFFNF